MKEVVLKHGLMRFHALKPAGWYECTISSALFVDGEISLDLFLGANPHQDSVRWPHGAAVLLEDLLSVSMIITQNRHALWEVMRGFGK